MDIRFFCRVMKKCFSRTTQPTIAGSNKDGWLHEMLKRAILEDEYNAEKEQPACGDDLRHALAEKMAKCVLSDDKDHPRG